MFWTLLSIAFVLSVCLGFRQAFRFRLLASRGATATTLLAGLMSLVWVGTVIWGFVAVGFVRACVILVGSFVAGQIARAVVTACSGGGASVALSPEAMARREVEEQTALAGAARVAGQPDMRSVIEKHNLTDDDLHAVYDRVLMDRGHDVALRAMASPEVVDWFFTQIGRDGLFNLDTSLEFIQVVQRAVRCT